MMIESMAGKAAALDGVCQDASPFTFSEDDPAIDFFGQQLVKGYCWVWKRKYINLMLASSPVQSLLCSKSLAKLAMNGMPCFSQFILALIVTFE